MTKPMRLLVPCALVAALAACDKDSGQETVSFSQQVKPILEKHCLECHAEGGKGAEKSGLVMETHEALMKGTRLGSVIDPGSAISSTLYLVVAGKTHPTIQMPHGKSQLNDAEVAVIERWIDQGAMDN